MPRIDNKTLPIEVSVYFDKEDFLDQLLDSIHTTREEFERLFTLEEQPMDITIEDYSDAPLMTVEYIITTKQQFHIRHKTVEEMAGDQSRFITEGEK